MKKTSTQSSSLATGFASKTARPVGETRHFQTKTLFFALAFLCTFLIKAQTTTNTVLIPTSLNNSTTSIPCGQVTLLQDDGGSGSYSSNADGYTVINPGINATTNLSGTYDFNYYTYLYIWEGTSPGGTLLATYGGNNASSGNLNFTSLPGQTITVELSAGYNYNNAGVDFTVTFPGGCSTAPCSGIPPTNSVVPMYVNPVCPNAPATMSLSTAYGTDYGITIQWQSSTSSPLGPWTNVSSNGNGSIYTTTGIDSIPSTDIYFSAAITCSNGGHSTQAIAADVMVAGPTYSTVPAIESFDELLHTGDLPNCSWVLDPLFSTYTTSPQYAGLYGNNSQNFLAAGDLYNNSNPNTTYYAYSNGIQLNAGVTYSASAWYLTNSYQQQGVDHIALSLGTAQDTTGLVTIAQTGSQPFAPIYRPLSNTFNVATSGIYYLATSVTRDSYQYPYSYLAIDDISVIAPCALNAPTVAVFGPTAVCVGNPINLTATGADTYSWSTGSANANVSIPTSQAGQMNYMVVATNTASGCSLTVSKPVNVIAAPLVSAFTTDPNNGVCPGGVLTLYAVGSASSYTWNTNTTAGANTTVSPTSNTTYTVLGSNSSNCVSSATITINALQAPTVGGVASRTAICIGEAVTLTGNDASLTYSWVANSAVLIGSPVSAMPSVATNYQVYGTDPSTGCTGTALISINVSRCDGINNISASNSGISVYPNPNNGEFTVELNNSTATTIHLVDVTGRILMTTTSSNGKANFNISTLSNGVYYVKTQSSDKTNVVKVVKQ